MHVQADARTHTHQVRAMDTACFHLLCALKMFLIMKLDRTTRIEGLQGDRTDGRTDEETEEDGAPKTLGQELNE